MRDADEWTHDPQRDGAGCTWCGAWAQVSDENLCRECHETDEERQNMSYVITTTLTNETTDRMFSEWTEDVPEWLQHDDGTPDMGAIFREGQREYGRCESRIYVDSEDGARPVGWFYLSRQQYEDCEETYLRGAWVCVGRVVAEAQPRLLEYV